MFLPVNVAEDSVSYKLALLTRSRHESGAFEISSVQQLVVDGRAYY